MKRLLVGDHRDNLLSTIELILKHWGYRVLASSRQEQIGEFLEQSSPDLLIMGADFLAGPASPLHTAIRQRLAEEKTPLIVLRGEKEPAIALPHDELRVPVDIFVLFELVQRHLEKFPRKNLRLSMQLPGMLYLDQTCHLAEVLSLSTRGLFIKTGFRLDKGNHLRIIFPLLGMKRELELEGKVLYRVHPDPDNNYLQGLGMEFSQLRREDFEALEAFIESRFLGELSSPGQGGHGVNGEDLRCRVPEATLRLM